MRLTITAIGRRGDGIAHHNGKRVLVPLTIPGDEIDALVESENRDGIRASVQTLITPSPQRQTPPCPHFGTCGGCSLQHLNEQAETDLKLSWLTDALAKHNITAPIKPMFHAPARSRRRADLAVVHTADGVMIGFHARRSHTVTAIPHCQILVPQLQDLLPPLAHMLETVLPQGKPGEVKLTATTTGPDVLLRLPLQKLDTSQRVDIAAWAQHHGLSRLMWHGIDDKAPQPEALFLGPMPAVVLSGAVVSPPPGSFLQASEASEAFMAQTVINAAGKAKQVADLFCGCGTFTFALAQKAKVFAVDGDGPALEALEGGIRQAKLSGRITTQKRDLFKEPLSALELNAYQTVVFDPPRAGAYAQVEHLSRSKVPTVVAVSCDPDTFARDAAQLIAGGYTLNWVQPVDQFRWSAHLEVVACFTR